MNCDEPNVKLLNKSTYMMVEIGLKVLHVYITNSLTEQYFIQFSDLKITVLPFPPIAHHEQNSWHNKLLQNEHAGLLLRQGIITFELQKLAIHGLLVCCSQLL